MKALLLSALALSIATVSAEPSDVTKLRKDWKKARERAIEPIDRKYMDALKALQARLVREKRLDDAVLVDREMKALAGAGSGWFKSTVTPEMLTVGEWRFDSKEPQTYTTHITFNANGEVRERGEKTSIGKWIIEDGILRLDLRYSWNEFGLEYDTLDPVLAELRFDGGVRKGTTLTHVPK